MPIDRQSARDYSAHERFVMDAWRGGRPPDDRFVQPPSPGGGGSQILLARIMGFWTEDYTAIGYRGYLIPARNAELMPEPAEEEWLYLGVWAYPAITYMRDLYYAVPGIPFATPGRSDVPVIWTPDAAIEEEDGGGRYMLLWPIVIVCIDP